MIETVEDLINELQRYPLDTLVFDFIGDKFTEIKYCEEIYLGDSANPNCKIVRGLKLS